MGVFRPLGDTNYAIVTSVSVSLLGFKSMHTLQRKSEAG